MKNVNIGRKSNFLKIALKRVLTLPKARSRKMRQFPLKNMGLQNKKHIRGDKTLKIQKCGPNVNINV